MNQGMRQWAISGHRFNQVMRLLNQGIHQTHLDAGLGDVGGDGEKCICGIPAPFAGVPMHLVRGHWSRDRVTSLLVVDLGGGLQLFCQDCEGLWPVVLKAESEADIDLQATLGQHLECPDPLREG